MPKSRFGNYQITFRMQTPVMLGWPWIAFDGILAHLINRRMRGQMFWSMPSKKVVSQDFLYEDGVMPLDKTKDVFHASVSQFSHPRSTAKTATVYKRFSEPDSHKIKTRRRWVSTASGLFKNYAMKIPYLPVEQVRFYFRGDLKEVLDLLDHLPGLGKKVAYGYGQYFSLEVEETNEDYSLVKDGKAMRPLPIAYGWQGRKNMMLAYRSPYWDKQNVKQCVPPGGLVREG